MLIELGASNPSFDLHYVRDFVETFEDPLAKLPVQASPKAVEVAAKIRAISQRNRAALLSGYSIIQPQLGDFFSAVGSFISSVGTKIGEVVQQPGFLQAAASAATFIPKIGDRVSALIGKMAPQQQTQAQQAQQAAGQGSPDQIALLLKGLGQFVGIQSMAQGLGLPPVGGDQYAGLADLIRKYGGGQVQGAIKAGEQDIISSAAFTGQSAAVEEAIRRGTPLEIPWGTIGLIAVGGLSLVAVSVTLARR